MPRSTHLLILVLPLLLLAAPVAAETMQMASSADLSPDGAAMVFSWRGDIWSAPTLGGEATRLTRHPAMDYTPRYSPDGSRIAFVSDRGRGTQVHVMPATGGEARPVTFETDGNWFMGWYPDGESILVRRDSDRFWQGRQRFFRVSLADRVASEMLFDAYGSDAAISPDGRRLLFTREGVAWWRKGYTGSQAGQIWLYDLEEESFRMLLGGGGDHRWPEWMPDGKSFVYVGPAGGALNLMRYDLDSGARTELTRYDDDSVIAPAVSADGKTIVYRHLFDLYRLRPGEGEIPAKIKLEAVGDRVTPPITRSVLKRASEAAFSVDGLEVAIVAGGDIWVMDTVLKEPRRVTNSPEEERSPVFLPDHSAILFASDRDGQSDIYKAERSDDGKWWWQNDEFRLTRLTNDPEMEAGLSLSPDGKRVAFVRGRGDIVVADPDLKDPNVILESSSPPSYEWSPDARYIAYAVDDENSNRDVWIVASDGSGEAVNVSRHPDEEGSPAWSPDGKILAFTGRRWDQESDIYYVWLRESEEQETKRDRTLEDALAKMKKGRKAAPAKAAPPVKPAPVKSEPEKTPPAEPAGEKAPETPKAVPEKAAEPKKEPSPPPIDFEGIHERVRRISIPNVNEGGLFWSPDGKKLAFRARIDGKNGTYAVTFPSDLKPKLLTTTVGSSPTWIKSGNRILWLVKGVPASTVGSKTTPYTFTVRQETDRSAHQAVAFDVAWRLLRDWFYDESMNNRNWDEIRRKYRDAAAAAPDRSTFARVISLMLGELNASHLGFNASSEAPTWQRGGWAVVTAHLGLRFEPAHKGPGLLVAEVIRDGPTERAKSRVLVGETVLAIDGTAVDPAMDLTTVLNIPAGERLELKVRGTDGEERTIEVSPTTLGGVRRLLYREWVRTNRRKVSESSGGRLGYIHVQVMQWSSFEEFQRELYAEGYGKDGLVIDIRYNGGGFTADYLLTSLTQPVHAYTTQRAPKAGYPQDRQVYATWSKPITVLVNQHSFSNAEIFGHAIKTLGRGKLVGVPSAGGVISTSSRGVMDMGFLRIPLRGWYVRDTGEDMERNGVVPDYVVWPEPGELPAGIDRQLTKAVEVLLSEVEEWETRPRPELKKASERR